MLIKMLSHFMLLIQYIINIRAVLDSGKQSHVISLPKKVSSSSLQFKHL